MIYDVILINSYSFIHIPHFLVPLRRSFGGARRKPDNGLNDHRHRYVETKHVEHDKNFASRYCHGIYDLVRHVMAITFDGRRSTSSRLLRGLYDNSA